MRVSQGHNLPTVGGVRQDLLIARHRRVKNHLTDRGTGSANGKTAEDRAIFQYEDSRLRQKDLPVVMALCTFRVPIKAGLNHPLVAVSGRLCASVGRK